jgi:hypothetical protein
MFYDGLTGITGANTFKYDPTGATGFGKLNVGTIAVSGPAYVSGSTGVVFGNTAASWALANEGSVVEIGYAFSTSSILTLGGLSCFHPSGMSSTSHNLHIWNSIGSLIATATTTSETTSAWNFATINTAPLTLSVGNYTVSMTLASDFLIPFRSGTLPETRNGITLTNNVYSNTAGSYPTTLYGNTSEIGVDIVLAVVANLYTSSITPQLLTTNRTLTVPDKTGTLIINTDLAPYPQIFASGGTGSSYGGSPKIIFGMVSPSTWVGSFGIASISKTGTGTYTLTFVNSFANVPSITCQLFSSLGYTGLTMISAASTNGCSINTYGNTGSPFDFDGFHIQVIGI